MARIRTIKPEFPQSESMGRVSREARLCFIMIWTICDDAGRVRGNSRMLASLLYPYDDDAGRLIDGWLGELEREGCVERYQVGTDTYIRSVNWLKHQKIDKPSPSRLPSPDEGSRIVANDREASTTDLVSSTLDLVSRNVPRTNGAPKGAVVVEDTPLPDWLDREAWTAFLEMRVSKKAKSTPRAIKLLIRKLTEWRLAGHDTTAILDASTVSNWTDIYEPKGLKNGNGRVPRKSNHETFYDAASAVAARIASRGNGQTGGPEQATILLLPTRADKTSD